MACDVLVLSAVLWLASGPDAASVMTVPAVASAQVPTSVASEPLFADIVRRAAALRGELDSLRARAASGEALKLSGFSTSLTDLASLDMKGHLELAKRGTDGDLKCILRGISQDIPVRLKDVQTAPDQDSRNRAFNALDDLLRDNVEVITAPPAAPV